jgi:hypothetical protein
MEWTIALGYPGVEIYPKQERLAGPMDVGNWINMPYFAAWEQGGSKRVAVLQSGERVLDPDAFLALAASKAVTAAQLEAIEPPGDARFKDMLEQAPPCLQTGVAAGGFQKGGRDNALFSMGVYLRKRFPDDWQERLDTYNNNFIEPPLGSKDVTRIAASLNKKGGYFYKCNDTPLDRLCNKQICLTRKHGVGQGNDDPGVAFGSITKIDGTPPLWIVDVNGMNIQCATPELMNQARFHVLCVEILNIWPTPIKPAKWAEMMRKKLQSAVIMEAPPEATLAGRLWAYLLTWFQVKGVREEWEFAARYFPVLHDGKIWFHQPTFAKWLQQEYREKVEPNELFAILKARGGESKMKRVAASGPNAVMSLWNIPAPDGLEVVKRPSATSPDSI